MKLFSFDYPKSPPENPSSKSPRKKLVFLHGMGGNGSLWRPIAAGLEEDYDLRCLDQRGHGNSLPPKSETSFTPLDYAQDLVDTLLPDGFSPAWVIGHSMGVRTACGYAKLAPQAIEGLVLIDLGFSGVAGGGIGNLLSVFLKKLPRTFANRNEAREFMTAHCPDVSIGQYLIAVSKIDPETNRLFFPFDFDSLLKTIEDSRNSDTGGWLEEFVRTTGKPVYILRGATSRVFSKSEYEQEKARFTPYPNVRFIEVEGAGHGLPFEKRVEFVQMLKSWVQ